MHCEQCVMANCAACIQKARSTLYGCEAVKRPADYLKDKPYVSDTESRDEAERHLDWWECGIKHEELAHGN